MRGASQKPSSNFFKYCACQERSISWLILLTYEKSVTICGARITLQLHQIPDAWHQKSTLMIAPVNIWDVIYNARSNKSHPPTSPNLAPATKCFNFQISAENPWVASAKIKTIRRHSEHEIVISHAPLRRPYPPHLGDAFCMEKITFRAPAISQNFTNANAAPAIKSNAPTPLRIFFVFVKLKVKFSTIILIRTK